METSALWGFLCQHLAEASLTWCVGVGAQEAMAPEAHSWKSKLSESLSGAEASAALSLSFLSV